MAYKDFEEVGGSPVELYHFVKGTDEWFYTSGDEWQSKDGDDYKPSPMSRNRLDVNDEARTNNIELTAPRDHPIVALFKIDAPSSTLTLVIFRKQREDPDAEWTTVFTGEVRSCVINISSGDASLLCIPSQSRVERRLLNVITQPLCNNRLYDNRCQVDRADWTFTYPVAEFVDANTGPIVGFPAGITLGRSIRLGGSAAVDFASDDTGFMPGNPAFILAGGVATFEDQKIAITLHIADGIWLQRSFRGLNVGDELVMYAGCNKTISTCRDKFDNRARFLGFPYLPGKNPFGDEGIA